MLRKSSKTRFARESKDINSTTTVVIDGSALSYAALHSMGHLSYGGGETGVIFGFLKRVLMLAEKFKTPDFIFCWDDKTYFRKDIYPEYKSGSEKNRARMTPADREMRASMYRQMDLLKHQVLPAMGFANIFQQSGYEADDLLAYWAHKQSKWGKVVLATDDRDLYQCLGHCEIYHPRNKKVMDLKLFEAEYKIKPLMWAAAKAIGGCGSDSVKGIRGASDPAKNPNSKAIRFLRGELRSGKIYEAITSPEGRKIAKRNMELVMLPFPGRPPRRMIKRIDHLGIARLRKVFDKYRFMSFLGKDFDKWLRHFNLKTRSNRGKDIFAGRKPD